MMRSLIRTVSFILFLVAVSVGFSIQPASAQAARNAQPPATGTLHVTVVDPSGAVIPNATVTVVGVEEATKAAAVAPVQTSERGIATISGMALGRYTVQAEFPGFETRLLKDVRVRAGENKQVVPLPIQRVEDSVTVGQDRQEAAADPRGPSFGSTLTREQLDALSDDPEELRRQLQDIAGPGAVIKIDSFEGGALPPKAMIRSIRISRDQFAAENHSAGGVSIDIVTQPGIGPIRFNTNFRLREGSLSGRSPFTPKKGPEQIRNYNLNFGGTLVREKSNFSVNMNGMNAYETPILNVALPGGTRSEALLGVRTPRNNVNVNGQLDYALTLDQTLRFGFNSSRNTNRNLGIGGFEMPERGYSTENRFSNLRAQHIGPLGRRAFTRTRLALTWSDSESRSAVEAIAVRVLDSSTTGGAQVAGGDHTRSFSFGSDLDYVRGMHTFRTGIALDGSRARTDETSNYLGTYTFESLEAFNEGRPRSYTRRIGDPNIRYQNLQGALYVQDDIRLRRNLTLSPGVRYLVQTHVRDHDNFAPRFGVTWAPFASGSTTLRSSWGIFYDWLPVNTYEQTIRVNGFRQQELNIIDPSFPDPGDVGVVPPINRYLLSDTLRSPRTTRLSAGVDRSVTRTIRFNATYSYMRGGGVLRGRNLNAPMHGVRPDPIFGNIIEVVSDASSRQHQLSLNVNANPGALFPAINAPRISWRRTTVFVNYTLGTLENNTDGAFNPPATGDLEAEWGPAGGDIRHRLNVTFNNQVIRNLLMGLNLNASSAAPYTMRTGRDDNGDLIFNDRPAGVGRGTLRGTGPWTVNMQVGYNFSFGTRGTALPPGIAVTVAGPGAQPVVQSVEQGNARYRLQFIVQVQNLTNHANYAGYSGVMTSSFFGRPTMVSGTRKVEAGLQFSF